MNQATDEVKLLTVRETAERLRCSEANVYALIERGDLTVVRIGPSKGYRVTPDDLAAFIESRKESKRRADQRRPPPRPRLKHIRLN